MKELQQICHEAQHVLRVLYRTPGTANPSGV